MSIPPKPSAVNARRPYRSKLRSAQAAATRRTIVEAALGVFLKEGYAGATMQRIAEAAGVVVETIYRSFDGKAGLFKAVVEAAVAGGAVRAERPVEERPAIRAVIEERDPRRKLELHAATQPGIQERLGPLYRTLAEAAALDPKIAGIWEEIEAQRLHGMGRFAADLADAGGLRADLTIDEARDVAWTIYSHAVYRMLVEDRGWTPQRYGRWLVDTLADALLAPEPASSTRNGP